MFNVRCRSDVAAVRCLILGAPLLADEDTSRRQQRRRLPGMGDKGTIVLPNQWSLKPTGKQVKLGDFPVQVTLHPSQPWAAVLHAGYGDHEVAIIDLKAASVVSRVSIPQAFYGMAFDREGKRLLLAAGSLKRFTNTIFATVT